MPCNEPIKNSDGETDWDISERNIWEEIWEKSNDPSPVGWRIPTKDELKTLIDTVKVFNEWTSENDVNGRKFTDRTSGKSIFLPAAGLRDYDDGALYVIGLQGNYVCNDFNYHSLTFTSDSRWFHTWNCAYALSVRPVAE